MDHLHFELEIDFENQTLIGDVVLSVQKINRAAKSLILDAEHLKIKSIKDESTGEYLNSKYGAPNKGPVISAHKKCNLVTRRFQA